MKIIIVGAGLSGLSTAIALLKHVQPICQEGLDMKVYDESDPHRDHDKGCADHPDLRLKNQGAAISLQSNGMRVLRDLDPELARKAIASGQPCKNFTWKTAGDYLLGKEYQNLLLISRPILVRCLWEALPKDVLVYRTVARVETSEGRRPVVHFGDGGSEEADLVIGADGIRSPVRKSLFGDGEDVRPKYLGTCGVGGVLSNFSLPPSCTTNPDVKFILGPNGNFGYCGLSQSQPDKLLFFSFYDSATPPERGAKPDHAALRERHRDWSDPVIAQCIEKATLDNIYPIFYMPDLPSWGRDGCVLVGDAAHAVTPSSGQGGSQAFEDGIALALLLAAFLERHDKEAAVDRSIHGLYEMRHKRIEAIKAHGLSLKGPKMPWSLMTTLGMYAGMFLALRAKNMLGWWKGIDDDGVRSWDAKDEVRCYLAGGRKESAASCCH